MAAQQAYTYPALVPSIVVRDVPATLEWFNKLGFATVFTLPSPDGGIAHAEVARDADTRLMLGPDTWGHTPGSTGMGLYIKVDGSVDAYHDRVMAAGITVTQPLTDQFWGGRTFTVEHPDGYRITFWEHVRDVSPEEMQRAMAQMASM
ncbi:MAG: VOC family protein [Chloroflexota bacterium]